MPVDRLESEEKQRSQKEEGKEREKRGVRLVRIERPSETRGDSSKGHVSSESLEDGGGDVDLVL